MYRYILIVSWPVFQTTLSVVAAAAAATAEEACTPDPLCFTRATFIIGFLAPLLTAGELVMSKVASFSMSCSVLKLLTLLFGLRGKE